MKQPNDNLDELGKLAAEAYDRCIQFRNFEIEQLVQRNNFFILFQGFLLSAVAQLDTYFLSFILSVVGIIMSYFQWKAAAGAKFWQEYWEAKLFDTEDTLNNYLKSQNLSLVFSMKEDSKKIVRKHLKKYGKCSVKSQLILYHGSVSAIPIYVGISCFFIWSYLAGYFLGLYNN